MINHSKILSNNATPIGICSLLISLGAAAYATVGYFDTRVSYCDTRSKPCTLVMTQELDAVPIEYRKNEQILIGNGLNKTVAALGSVLASTVAIASLSIAANNREMIDEDNSLSSNEYRTKKLIQSDLQIQIAEIEAEAQAKLHRKLTYDATAEMYLDESPELVDDIAEMRVKAEQQAKEEAARELEELEVKEQTTVKVDIPTTPDNREHYLNVGDRILDKLGTLTQSTILISSPGAGKTTAICTAWGRMKKRLGDKFHATVIVYKVKDKAAFEGIADEVICFPHNPDDAVIAILNFVEEMKTGVTGNNTRRLFIDDFLTTWSEIEALYKGKYLTHDNDFTFNKKLGKAPVTDWLISQLNAVFLVGRESDDALWISSHSPNVEDLPFVESKGARIAGNLLFLARQDPENSNGNYEVIQQNINNAHLVSLEQKRRELAATLPGLIELSQESGEPIILTSHGNSGGWELGLVGKHIRNEYEDYRQQWSTLSDIKQPSPTVSDIPLSAPTQNPIIHQVKQLRNEDKSYTEIMKLVWGQSDKPEQELIETYLKLCLGNSIDPLTRNARTIYNYISERVSCSCDALKKWCNRNEMPDEVRTPAIQELLILNFIVDADNGYSQTKNAF